MSSRAARIMPSTSPTAIFLSFAVEHVQDVLLDRHAQLARRLPTGTRRRARRSGGPLLDLLGEAGHDMLLELLARPLVRLALAPGPPIRIPAEQTPSLLRQVLRERQLRIGLPRDGAQLRPVGVG